MPRFSGLACRETNGARQSERICRCRDRIRRSSVAAPWTWSNRAALSAMWRRRWGLPSRACTRWRHQDLVDRGPKPGGAAQESAELAAARQRIDDLGEELKILRKA